MIPHILETEDPISGRDPSKLITNNQINTNA